MLKKSRVLISIIVVLIFCAMFILLTRKFAIIEPEYKSFNIKQDYIEITCEFVKINKFEMTQEDDISKFIAEINSTKVRKTDFVDEIIDKTEPITNGYHIELKRADGTTDTLVLANSTENNIGKIGYIFYNGVRYKIKGELSEYILSLLKNYNATEIKEVSK